jgi:predicted membrane protein
VPIAAANAAAATSFGAVDMAKRNENARIRTRKLAVAAMLCALGVVLLYVGSVIEVLDLTMVGISSVLVFFAVLEMGNPFPFLIYFVTAILSMLLLPSKFAAVFYLLFGGIYPILKAKLERLPMLLSWVLKFVYFNAVMTLVIAASLYLFGVDDPDVGFNLFFYGLGNVTFFLYDVATTKLITLYLYRLRKRLRLEKYFEK